MKQLALIATAALIIGVAGCGGGSSSAVTVEAQGGETANAEETPTTEEASSPPVEKEETNAPTVDHAKSGGIAITVKGASSRSNLKYEGGTISSSTPNGEARNLKAPQGGSYVFVETVVKNETSEGLDLTCGFPVEVKLNDASGQRFNPVEELAGIKGNPECNAELQPGFKDDMTYVFLVPPGAEIESLQFKDVSNFNKEYAAAEIAIPGL